MTEKKRPKITIRDKRRVRPDDEEPALSAVPTDDTANEPEPVADGAAGQAEGIPEIQHQAPKDESNQAESEQKPAAHVEAESAPEGAVVTQSDREGGGQSEAYEGAKGDRMSEARRAQVSPRPSQRKHRREQEELEKARTQAGEYLEHLQRLKAEFDNYRKRVLKEQTRAVEMASEPVMRRLLEVLDDFDLALMSASGNDRPDFDRFLHGVELVFAKLQEVLRSEGLERIDADGKPFDPERHEALMQSGEDDGEPYVADVFRQGYTLRGRVLRPAGVKVERKAV